MHHVFPQCSVKTYNWQLLCKDTLPLVSCLHLSIAPMVPKLTETNSDTLRMQQLAASLLCQCVSNCCHNQRSSVVRTQKTTWRAPDMSHMHVAVDLNMPAAF
jgi:hypothetical protein